MIIQKKNLIATAWHFSTIHITGQELQGGEDLQPKHLNTEVTPPCCGVFPRVQRHVNLNMKCSVVILNNRCGFHGLHQHSGVEQLRVKRPSKVFRVHSEWLASVKNANAIAEADHFLPMDTWILW